jgi:hypothetical protein
METREAPWTTPVCFRLQAAVRAKWDAGSQFMLFEKNARKL